MTVAQMTKIKLDEISLVDYPAHMVNGFPVIKSASTENSNDIMDALGKRNTEMPTEAEVLTKALAEASADDIQKMLAARADVADIAKAITPVESFEEDIFKNLPEPVKKALADKDEEIAKAKAEATERENEANIAKAAKLDGEAIAKSKELTNLAFDHDVVAPALRKFAEANPEAGEAIDTMLKAVNAQAGGAIFGELGTTAPVVKSDSDAALENIAKALVADGKATDFHDGFAKAVADPANKSLVDAHFKGGN